MRTPKYRIRKDRGYAYVEINKQRVRLPGPAGSPESLEAYARIIQRRAAAQIVKQNGPSPADHCEGIADLARLWLEHCRAYYMATANTRSNEFDNCRHAVRPLVKEHGGLPVAQFGPLQLEHLQNVLATGEWWLSPGKKAKPWCRTSINSAVNRIKRMFRWGLQKGFVTAEQAAMIAVTPALRKGRTCAKESKPVVAVADSDVDATLPYMSSVVRAMVQLHRLTGMRSDNLCSMRPCDIDMTGDVWIYRPHAHKNTHNEKDLVIPLGPRCQKILRPFLGRDADAPCFSPREVVGHAVGRRAPGIRYTTNSYRNAVHRAIEKANDDKKTKRQIPMWHPHQLRHSVVKTAKDASGLEGARAYVGHSVVSTTAIYEERDLALAISIARKIG